MRCPGVYHGCICRCGVGISKNCEASGTQSPYNHRGRPGQKYMYRRTDMHTLGSQGRPQGRDKALARRVQNQDLVQGLV